MQTIRLALAAAAFALAGAAHAQLVGTYTGTTSDGLLAQITVGDDGAGGLVFTGDTFQWNMDCQNGTSYFGWWGVGQNTPLTGRTLTVTTNIPYLYEKVFMKFSADGQTVTGNFVGDEPIYQDLSVNKKTMNCAGKKVTFSATLGAGQLARPAAVPAGARLRLAD